MSSRLLSLMRKEFLQLSRDWMVIFISLYFFVEPVQCAVSIFLSVKELPLAVYDADRTQASRALIAQLSTSEHFDLHTSLDSPAGLEPRFQSGEVRIGLIIPSGFERNLTRGDVVRVQLIADGSDAYSAGVAMGYAEQIIAAFSRRIELERVGLPAEKMLARLPVVVNRIRARYDPGLRFTNFIMLSMVAMVIPELGVVLGSAFIVREKEKGMLEQLMVTPTRPWELIAAKLLPLGVIKMVGLAVGVAIAVWGIGVPIRGSLTLYFALSAIVYLVSAGLGIAVGTLANNMQQALLLSFFLLFPMIFLSGTMTPKYAMPQALQWLSMFNPLRYYVDITVGIFLKGVGIDVLWPQVAALAALGVVIFGGALVYFRRSLA